MVSLTPFRALRPQSQYTDVVAAPPYDVMSRAEARAMIEGLPHSILRVTRPDAILADEIAMDDPKAYSCAQDELRRLIKEEVLTYDDAPTFYLYTQQMGVHRQTGIVGLASAEDYWSDHIKKHEFTLPRKEDDRMRQVKSLGAHLGPVFLTHEPHEGLRELIKRYQASKPDVYHQAPDGILHELWPVTSPRDISLIQEAMRDLDALYIADGHHRAAAAARVARDHAELGHTHAGHFLSVSFASDELLVLPYQRVVTQLASADELMASLKEKFEVIECDAPADQDPSAPVIFPPEQGMCGMYLQGQWYLLRPQTMLKTEIQERELTAQLDVSVLQTEVLSPLLDVKDPRTCEHISFVGGIRGFRELEQRADAESGVAFALYPTSVAELMAIADLGEVMPPKSTWFEPKLRSGLFINVFDSASLQG
jgi:uncharacterized protein (DUF1015 family)